MIQKKKFVVSSIILLAIAACALALLGGCTGPAGPPGPAGEATKCRDCHNDTTLILAKQIQAANSVHLLYNDFERNAKDCAICHTHEGFVERIKAGTMTIAKDVVVDPTPPNCRTCHTIHTTYSKSDFALRTTSAVKLQLTGTTFDAGQGNLCAQCHQPRWADKPPAVGAPDIKIASNRMGPHHGVQSAVLSGVGQYGDFTGSSVHYKSIKDGCVDCHAAAAYGRQAGGHSFKMGYEYHGAEIDNLAACTSCHKDLKTFDRNGIITEVKGLITQLRQQLIAKGILNKADDLAVPGTYSSKLVGAFWNFKMVTEDRSNGIHNPQYVKTILKTAIEASK